MKVISSNGRRSARYSLPVAFERPAASLGWSNAGRRVPARYTSAAPSADGLGWFLGTDGLGVLWFDGVAIHPERLPFGLESDRVAALVAQRGGVWVLTEPSSSANAAESGAFLQA